MNDALFIFAVLLGKKWGRCPTNLVIDTDFCGSAWVNSTESHYFPLVCFIYCSLLAPADRYQWEACQCEASPPEAEAAGKPWGSNKVGGEEEGLPPQDGEALNKEFLIQA
ncbi:hypothetical protein ACEUC3_05665 [Aeromonas bivalvium]|uniref:hypothetical protein n=1 Tax=Aeromonas bivalvium TaxID=440079 RepID=UPI0038D067BE